MKNKNVKNPIHSINPSDPRPYTPNQQISESKAVVW